MVELGCGMSAGFTEKWGRNGFWDFSARVALLGCGMSAGFTEKWGRNGFWDFSTRVLGTETEQLARESANLLKTASKKQGQ